MINALKKIGIVSVTVVLSIFFFLPTTASAQGLPPLIPACATDSGASAGNCTGCHFLAFFGNLTEIILSYTSVVVLLMIVIGGLVWITSAGKPDRVQRGQQIIIGAIIGAALVFFSYIIVNTFIVAFLAPEKRGNIDFGDVELFGDRNWYDYCLTDAELGVPVTPSGEGGEAEAAAIVPASECATNAGSSCSNGSTCPEDGSGGCLCKDGACVKSCGPRGGFPGTYECKTRTQCETEGGSVLPEACADSSLNCCYVSAP